MSTVYCVRYGGKIEFTSLTEEEAAEMVQYDISSKIPGHNHFTHLFVDPRDKRYENVQASVSTDYLIDENFFETAVELSVDFKGQRCWAQIVFEPSEYDALVETHPNFENSLWEQMIEMLDQELEREGFPRG